MLFELGFDEWNFENYVENNLKIEEIIDDYDYFSNKEYKIDIIFGRSIIFLIFDCNLENRNKFLKGLMKFCKVVGSKKKISKLINPRFLTLKTR